MLDIADTIQVTLPRLVEDILHGGPGDEKGIIPEEDLMFRTEGEDSGGWRGELTLGNPSSSGDSTP